MSFCCKPGIVWSFGGAGSTIGANNGSPLPAAFGVAGVGVAVPGEPAVGAGVIGTVCDS
eukprot:gene8341-9792_t